MVYEFFAEIKFCDAILMFVISKNKFCVVAPWATEVAAGGENN
jgi:hypothetical protein